MSLVTYSCLCIYNPAGVAAQSGDMAVEFTLGSLLGLVLLVAIVAVIVLGLIICLCVCRRKQKAKGTGENKRKYIYIFDGNQRAQTFYCIIIFILIMAS